MAVPPAPVRVPSQRPLAPRVASVTSVPNDKDDDDEMILGAVHRSPGICLTAEENPRKPQLGDLLLIPMLFSDVIFSPQLLFGIILPLIFNLRFRSQIWE